MQKTLLILRGVSGSGKSTYAQRVMVRMGRMFHHTTIKCSADDFFIGKDGVYNFNPNLLGKAHEKCKDKARKAMRDGIDLVVIDNTNTQEWEYLPYIMIARDKGYRVIIRQVGKFDEESLALYAQRNAHGVPLDAIKRMANRFEKKLV